MARRILMTGGGTSGTINPMLAVAEAIKLLAPDADIGFIVSRKPAELALVRHEGYGAAPFPAGKWRRYADPRNSTDLFRIAYAFLLAVVLFLRRRPAVVVSAGSFVSVPLVWAAGLLRIPVHLHQQDVQPGLANRLMRRAATSISSATETAARVYGGRVRPLVTGNPVRRGIKSPDPERIRRRFGLASGKPVVCVVGGSSGARALDDLLAAALPEFSGTVEILHLTGHGRTAIPKTAAQYHQVAFLENGIADAFAAADLIVTRAGFSTLSEISLLGRACVVIPMPGTHQEANAHYFADRGAALLLDQRKTTPTGFARAIQDLLNDRNHRNRLAGNMRRLAHPDAAERIAREILRNANGHS